MAEKIIKRAFREISDDTHGLSSHSLRKSWAMRLYKASGHDLLIVRWSRPPLGPRDSGLPNGTRARRISHPQDRLDPAHEQGPRSRCMSGRSSRPTALFARGREFLVLGKPGIRGRNVRGSPTHLRCSLNLASIRTPACIATTGDIRAVFGECPGNTSKTEIQIAVRNYFL